LHQAVPEIPSRSPSALAKKALCELATVTPQSRSIIVHIYPLMAAGCEAMDREDRKWITERWMSMSSRMKLGNLEKCLEVTKEVWSRRDAYAVEQVAMEDVRNDSSTTDAPNRDFNTLSQDIDADGPFCWGVVGSERRTLDHVPGHAAPPPSSATGEPSKYKQIATDNTGILEHEFTVRGRLHWLGVMKDWDWEGKI